MAERQSTLEDLVIFTLRTCLTLVLFSCFVAVAPGLAQVDTLTKRVGPHNLIGWKNEKVFTGVASQGPLPFELLIAQRGHVVRRIHGEPFVWRWMFQNHGRQVAYEAGPLHFAMECVLIDLKTGTSLGRYDCQQSLDKAPNWVHLLEKDHNHDFSY